MERGLLWLPLLAVFFWLAWSGWNEYQKVEAYRRWAVDYDKAKYDLYAVLGQQGDQLTWGLPTRQGPVNLQQVSLAEVREIRLQVDGQPIASGNLPQKARKIALELVLERSPDASDASVLVPFTDLEMAGQWADYLERERLKFAGDRP